MLRGFGTILTSATAVANALDANQSVTPLTGDTITMTDSNLNGVLYVNPAGTLANLTITLPTEANSRVNEQRDIFFSKAITALTINGATTIINNPTSSTANTLISIKKVAPNTWAARLLQ